MSEKEYELDEETRDRLIANMSLLLESTIEVLAKDNYIKTNGVFSEVQREFKSFRAAVDKKYQAK